MGVVPNSAGVDCGADCAAVEVGNSKEALKGAGEEAVGGTPKPAAHAVSLSHIAMEPASRRQSAPYGLHHQKRCPPEELLAHNAAFSGVIV